MHTTHEIINQKTLYGKGYKPHHPVCNYWAQPEGPCQFCDKYYLRDRPYAVRLKTFADWYFYMLSEDDKLTRDNTIDLLCNLLLYGMNDPDSVDSIWETKRKIEQEFPELYEEVWARHKKEYVDKVFKLIAAEPAL